MSRRIPLQARPIFTFNEISPLLDAAKLCVAPERERATLARLMGPHAPRGLPQEELLFRAGDAIVLSADLVLSQPSASGSTAFDRLARQRIDAPVQTAAAIAALRAARFRLLRIEGEHQHGQPLARDMLTGETLQVTDGDLPPLKTGTVLFCRVVMLHANDICLAGAITPLDEAACAVARNHPTAGRAGAAAGARWAEAIYAHVVRHGTDAIAGLNRPLDWAAEDLFEEEDDERAILTHAWADLGEATPSAALLQRTRQLADITNILDALRDWLTATSRGDKPLAAAIRRMLLVLLETVQRREAIGCGRLTMDAITQAADVRIAKNSLPAEARGRLAELRQLVMAGITAPGADDAELARLMQRIRGLRAKTVDHGCTEQEALAAAEKVAELLDRYGLSLGEVDFQAQPCEGAAVETGRRRTGPIDTCVMAVASFFDCRVWIESSKGEPLRYIFFGLRADVAAAHYLHEMVERAFQTETAAFRAGALYASMEGERRSASNSFQIGLARGIRDKLHVLRAARTDHLRSASGRDLVTVKSTMIDEEMAKLGLSLRARGGSGGKRVITDAFEAGREAGARFEFNPALKHAA